MAEFQMGDNEDPKAVKAMIQYLHTSDYDWAERDEGRRNPLMASKYENYKSRVQLATREEYERQLAVSCSMPRYTY
jgi:hypothetical protein